VGLLGGDLQSGGQLGVAPGGGVLVAISGGPGTMTEPGHDLFGRGPLSGEQGPGRVAQIVGVQFGHPDRCPSLVEPLVPMCRRDRDALSAR